MFSLFQRKEFNSTKGKQNENILDVLGHTGFIDILWRDNNSGSKGVAKRVEYENYSDPGLNTICSEEECRDEGMLRNLAPFIGANASRDKLIVFHQMGSHGPEYNKRYTKRLIKYTPVCRSNLLEKCTKEEVVNAYDNTIVHTDAFLDETIRLLEKYRDRYQVAMIYIADHGESLGEHGIFLHGIPYLIAPEAQKHVGALMWFGDGFAGIDMKKLREKAHSRRYSHDNIFSTFLGIFDVNTSLYQKSMDILAPMN
jgi:lipid A ethanolaminephosphotransferase